MYSTVGFVTFCMADFGGHASGKSARVFVCFPRLSSVTPQLFGQTDDLGTSLESVTVKALL